MEIQNIAVALLTGGGFVLINTIVNYYTGKKKAKLENDNTGSNTIKNLSEAYGLKIDAEVSIAEQWQKINAEIRKERDEERTECDRALEKQKAYFENKMEKQNSELQEQISGLKTQVNLLTDELNVYRNGKR